MMEPTAAAKQTRTFRYAVRSTVYPAWPWGVFDEDGRCLRKFRQSDQALRFAQKLEAVETAETTGR